MQIVVFSAKRTISEKGNQFFVFPGPGTFELHLVLFTYSYLVSRYNLLQLLAPAKLRRHKSRPIAAWRQFWILCVTWTAQCCLDRSFSTTSTTCLTFEDFTNWVTAIHTSDMTQPSQTLSFNTLYDVIVHIVLLLVPSCAILLCSRKVHKSYVEFSSRRRLTLAHLKMSASKSQHHIIKPAV